jgi:hypothetical protein
MQGHLAIDVSASCVTSACGQISVESNYLATRIAFLQRIAEKITREARDLLFSNCISRSRRLAQSRLGISQSVDFEFETCLNFSVFTVPNHSVKGIKERSEVTQAPLVLSGVDWGELSDGELLSGGQVKNPAFCTELPRFTSMMKVLKTAIDMGICGGTNAGSSFTSSISAFSSASLARPREAS